MERPIAPVTNQQEHALTFMLHTLAPAAGA